MAINLRFKCIKKSITKRMFIGIICSGNWVCRSLFYWLILFYSVLFTTNHLKTPCQNLFLNLQRLTLTAERSLWLEEIYNISSGSSYDIIIKRGDLIVFSSSIDIGLKEFPEDRKYHKYRRTCLGIQSPKILSLPV